MIFAVYSINNYLRPLAVVPDPLLLLTSSPDDDFGTTTATLVVFLALGLNFDAIKLESSIIHAFPFNSDKKRG
ncbi:hypothetical protein Tco_1147363, partial [Tanacetum coccineum]